jgi:hypothetical protein
MKIINTHTKFQNSASENPNLDGKKMDWEENKVVHFGGWLNNCPKIDVL